MDEDCRDFTTFSSPIGPCRYTRLPFGLASAPEMFQRIMEYVLIDINNVIVYLDDVIVFGKSKREHDDALFLVLEAFDRFNVKLNLQKCEIGVEEIEFLGLEISGLGIKPSSKKVQALMELNPPKNKEELNSFLGMVVYLGSRAINDLATLTQPLRDLSKKGKHFIWGELQQKAFEEIIKRLEQMTILSFYSHTDDTFLFADASDYGLGAVLVQVTKDDSLKPIAFASKCLSKEDRALATSEKEALACVWACEHFAYYLKGRRFVLCTDHQALETLLGVIKPSSAITSARIERLKMRIQEFEFSVKYVPGRKMIADFLSRSSTHGFDLGKSLLSEMDVEFIRSLITEKSGSITEKKLMEHSQGDETLKKICESLKSDVWTEETKKFKAIKNELTEINGIILRGHRIVIPSTLKNEVLNVGHMGHPGICMMKRRIREKYYWCNMDQDIEKFVNACESCRLMALTFPSAKLIRTKIPEKPWQMIAIDFLGPAPKGERILVIVDYFSRYVEAIFMEKCDTDQVILALEEIFSRLDWPEAITSDNGPPFQSHEFVSWCENNGILLRHSLPYQPRMNGEVEVQNKMIVKAIIIAFNKRKDYRKEVQNLLEAHRNTPHSVTGVPPLQLMLNRNCNLRGRFHSIFDLNFPNVDRMEIQDKDAKEKEKGRIYADKDQKNKDVELKEGDLVLIKRQRRTHKWETKNYPYKFKVVKKVGAAVTIVDEKGNWKVKDINELVKVSDADQILNEKDPVQKLVTVDPSSTIVGGKEGQDYVESSASAESTAVSSNEEQTRKPSKGQSNETGQMGKQIITRAGRMIKPPKRD